MPTDPDPDLQETKPFIVPIFSSPWFTFASFTPMASARARRVVVPFPLRMEVHPARGAVLRGLWADSRAYGPDETLGMAMRREHGFRFADGA